MYVGDINSILKRQRNPFRRRDSERNEKKNSAYAIISNGELSLDFGHFQYREREMEGESFPS